MAAFRAQASSSITCCAYDVFLSFRGEDTRKTFTDHLYTALVQAGFHTFRDDDEIERGEYIELELQKAIEQSRISIIVFSKTYATSRWCLDELVKILHRKKTYGQQVLPIFYDVEPSEVRKQTGSFAEAFTRHEERFGVETKERNEWIKKVKYWRAALKDASDIAGMDLKNGFEAQFIKKIVDVTREKLNRVLSETVSPVLIGIRLQVEKINLWLQDGDMDVTVIAICGMGGIGKTTIAKLVYIQNRENFDGSSFLANIRERSQEPNGVVELQQKLLSDIGKSEKLSSFDEGITKIADALSRKRLLLVLDDVDHVDQLGEVLGMRPLLSPGSKIILTTRSKRLLNRHQVHKVHQVNRLNYEESLELFSWYAFGQAHPTEDCLNQSIRVVNHSEGLPLALKVFGSSLSGTSVDVWESALKKLEAITDSTILSKLRISYDCLKDHHDKELFLHIACFFIGWDKDWTIKILDEYDSFPAIGIQNLIDRCLLAVNESNKLEMHNLIQAMGREIVRLESPKDLGQRTRLWHHNDSFNVLREKIGTDKIEGLILDMCLFEEDMPSMSRSSVYDAKKRYYEETHDKSFLSDLGNSLKRRVINPFSWLPGSTSLIDSSLSKSVETDAFSKMCKLKVLHLNYVQITGSWKKFPKRLRWLCWHGFPSRNIPSEFPMESLVALDLHYSKLKQVWKGTKVLKVLKILDLSHSHWLTETPDFSGVPNLETLILEDCVNLVKIGSIEKLEGLILLNLKDCINLKELPRNLCMLKFLETLTISGCSNLDWKPIVGRTTGSLKLPESTSEEVQSWQGIIMSWVSKPRLKPENSSFYLPRSLVKLSLAGCNLFDDDFPLDFSNLSLLHFLDLSENQMYNLPESIKDLTGLQELRVDSCKRLRSLPEISNIRLKWLSTTGCTSLKKISYQSSLPEPLNLGCGGCGNLVEVEGNFKLERMNGVDFEILKAWGFSDFKSADLYLDMSECSFAEKFPFWKLYQSGVYSFFLIGDKIPPAFSIKNEAGSSSLVSFTVPSLVDYKIRGLVLCCVYTTWKNTLSQSDLRSPLTTFMKNKTKHFRCKHCPVSVGIPKPNEDVTWISHWNFENLFDAGDEVQVEVLTRTVFEITGEKLRNAIEVKEVGILLLYEGQEEEMGSQSIIMHQLGIPETFPFDQNGGLYILGWQEVLRLCSNPHQPFYMLYP